METESKVVHAFRSFEAESGVHVSKWRWCGDFPPGLAPKYLHHRDCVAVLQFPIPDSEINVLHKVGTGINICIEQY